MKFSSDHRASLSAREFPQIIKYMGSKSRIIDFVVDGIARVHRTGPVCDLFAGSCTLSGALGGSVRIVSNDIQNYSRAFANVYLHPISAAMGALSVPAFLLDAEKIVDRTVRQLPTGLGYPLRTTLSDFNEIEERNRQLIDRHFDDKYHLFLRVYSGTWWSSEQCAWIDALRAVADSYLKKGQINEGDHSILLSCVMHAMAYAGQGTGHYAQYRDAKTQSSMEDINIYRQKSVASYFFRKLNGIIKWNADNVALNSHEITALDYTECLERISGGTVYADPPYAFVHYSRFYHAIETFFLYDYPELQIKGDEVVKGRYREDRHQSPFSIRSQVVDAFAKMFQKIGDANSNLVLSYSNAALLNLDEMIQLGRDQLGSAYAIEILARDHRHMTMGRKADRSRNVEETLLLAKRL
jgi:adenine-specific DNA-methyltransferase